MNAANPENSERLQRVLALLSQGGRFSTLDIMREAQVCAVNSCVSELRAAGYNIPAPAREAGVYYYTLLPAVTAQAAA